MSTKHAEILTICDEKTKDELPYFKKECWKKIQDSIEKAETYLTKQLNEIAMVRETSQLNLGSPASHSIFVQQPRTLSNIKLPPIDLSTFSEDFAT